MQQRKKKARVDGEGSLFERRGKWVAQVTSIGPDGRRKVVRRVTDTQDGARRMLTELKGDQDSHRLVVGGRATVSDWLDTWLNLFIKPKRAPRTFGNYHDVLEQHLPERIGKMPLTKLQARPEDLQSVFNVLAAKHERTADLLRAVLRSSFNRAIKLGRMKVNPVLATDAVQHHQAEGVTFTEEQALKFLDAAREDRLGAAFVLALSLGLRKGEVLGLKPEDIDLEKRLVHIRRSLQWAKLPGEKKGCWIERPPKRCSFRELPMTATIYGVLVHHIARRADEARTTKGWNDSGFLFASPTGARLHEKNVSKRFHEVCIRAGVPTIRFHDLRHSAGTMLNAQGASAFTIQKVLGHTQTSTTARYTHIPTSLTKAALEGVESRIEATRKKAEEQPTPESQPEQPVTTQVQ